MSAIVVGGAGALGRSLVKTLQKNSFKAISVDMMKNEEASVNITLSNSTPLEKQMGDLRAQVAEAGAVAGVFSSAGSWMGGSIGDDDFLQTMENMKRTNLDSALMAAHLSSKFLDKNGALVLTGADAALGATPGMIAYGITKCSTHFLVNSLSQDPKFLEKNASVFCVLPNVIDTPGNRAAMPDANFEDWTKPDDIAEKYVSWIKDPSSRPANGSMLSFTTQGGKNSTTLRKSQPQWEIM